MGQQPHEREVADPWIGPALNSPHPRPPCAPCKTVTPDCTTGRYGYSAGPGYDHVTGLGSIDVANLLENWSSAKSNPNTATVVVPSIDPSTVYQQAPDSDGYALFYTIRLSETGG